MCSGLATLWTPNFCNFKEVSHQKATRQAYRKERALFQLWANDCITSGISVLNSETLMYFEGKYTNLAWLLRNLNMVMYVNVPRTWQAFKKVNSFLSQSGSEPGRLKGKLKGLNHAKLNRLSVLSDKVVISVYAVKTFVQWYLSDLLSILDMYSVRKQIKKKKTCCTFWTINALSTVMSRGPNNKTTGFFKQTDDFFEIKS